MKVQSRLSKLRIAAAVLALLLPTSALAFHGSDLDPRIKQPLVAAMDQAQQGCQGGNQQMCGMVQQFQEFGNSLVQAQQNCQAGDQTSCQMIQSALQQVASQPPPGNGNITGGPPNLGANQPGADTGLNSGRIPTLQAPPGFGSGTIPPESGTSGGPPSLPNLSYYIAENGRQTGPLGTAELRQKIAAGTLAPNTLVWTDGMADWRPASDVADIAALF